MINVFSLAAAEIVCCLLALSTQVMTAKNKHCKWQNLYPKVALFSHSDRDRAAASATNAAAGVWAGLAAALAAPIAILGNYIITQSSLISDCLQAARKPSKCTVPCCLCIHVFSILVRVIS